MWGEGLQRSVVGKGEGRGGEERGSDPPGNVDVHVCISVCVCLKKKCVALWGCFNIQAALLPARISLNTHPTRDAFEYLSSWLKMSKKWYSHYISGIFFFTFF